MDINNINNFKITDNKIPKTNPNKSISPEINNELPFIHDNIDTHVNLNQLKSNQLTNELSDDQIASKFIKENKNLINNEIPKNLTIFELDNINDSSLNKELKFNKIKAFGPTNLPNNPNEIFINPKYL